MVMVTPIPAAAVEAALKAWFEDPTESDFGNPVRCEGFHRRMTDAITAALPHLTGWRPIAEAPKSQADGRRVDGIYLLGFIPDADFVSPDAAIDVIWWEPLLPNKRGGRGKWVANRFGEACDVEPTLWQPLPPPPGQEVDGGR